MPKTFIVALLLLSCSSVPKPCDPEVVAARQTSMAYLCRTKAEKTCPGFTELSEDKKLECPGVLECLDAIEKIEVDCHGN